MDLSEGYTFPTHITATDLRPDIVWWNDDKKIITLVELTVCFVTTYEKTWKGKRTYTEILPPMPSKLDTHPTLEMESRGLPNLFLNRQPPEFTKLLLDAS